ncbi:MAG: 4a-hydroxytetrahydrobiopterin dehydratase [Candidatus Thorarchaeota archaeon]
MAKTRRELANLTCVPCRGDTPAMEQGKIKLMLDAVPGWKKTVGEVDKIQKIFRFKNFEQSMVFVNRVAVIAEEQDHHPDIYIHWNEVTLTLYTHAINGLFDNDFILAAKIDEIK